MGNLIFFFRKNVLQFVGEMKNKVSLTFVSTKTKISEFLVYLHDSRVSTTFFPELKFNLKEIKRERNFFVCNLKMYLLFLISLKNVKKKIILILLDCCIRWFA